MFEDKYEVGYATYHDFLHTLIPGKFKQDVTDDGKLRTVVITSKTTLKTICGYMRGEIGGIHYYIVNFPEAFESQDIRPTVQVTLDTPQQVQTVLDKIKELNKKG